LISKPPTPLLSKEFPTCPFCKLPLEGIASWFLMIGALCPGAFYELLREGDRPGLLLLKQICPIGRAIEDLRIRYRLLDEAEFANRITYLPDSATALSRASRSRAGSTEGPTDEARTN